MTTPLLATLLLFFPCVPPTAPQRDALLVEAEAFENLGGWSVDTLSVEAMGSPYLLAHGLGQPVADATTSVILPGGGGWRVYARTYDWVERWDAPSDPGRFALLVDGEELAELGTEGADWGWRAAGSITRPSGTDARVAITLRDRTGFDGRCDALMFERVGSSASAPPDDAPANWRRALSAAPAPTTEGPFDLVVIGGGISGTAAAISAARMGCRVALIQNRAVLGGNASSEVRVWMKGGTRRGPFPRLGDIVEELSDQATASPGTAEEFEDDKKLAIARAEPKLSLFLSHHAHGVELQDGRIAAVLALDVREGGERRFEGRFFADCTGDGVIGVLAGADHSVRATGHLGASNMWRWEQAEAPQSFPETPWALQLSLDEFPYPKRNGEWFWEGGFDWHPIDELEAIRDWNLRAVFGAFQAMKSGERATEHANARLTWVAHVAGRRESRQLLGDVVLEKDDIVTGRAFQDGCVPTTWSIDLHRAQPAFENPRYPDGPFISVADFLEFEQMDRGYPVPYRCLYSRNVANLFMAGRCISVTHEALGTVRVMKTGGMMGEVVGKAASICVARGVDPRDVYASHWDELAELMSLPGGSRRASVDGELAIAPSWAWTRAGEPFSPGLDPATLPGLVLDDARAQLVGDWTRSTHEAGFVGEGYVHDGNADKGLKSAAFVARARQPGMHIVALTWRSGGNRASNVPVQVKTRAGTESVRVDQRSAPPQGEFLVLAELKLVAGEPVKVVVSNEGTDGFVVVDAVQLRRMDG